jgi:hypothetical protein
VHARLYTLAGELAGSASAPAAGGILQMGTSSLAGGVYILSFEYSSPAGQRKRELIKAAIVN